ncbi:MAG: hypothetical protein LWW95_03925 [Candidatus Desulfofervidus auxilii]|nr:hypothetical protein [Candidatus Desulfofervidus auxilii]
MPIALKELIKFVENLGYKVIYPEKLEETSLVDELLGEFEGAIPEDMTSTEYLKKLRESGYGKY